MVIKNFAMNTANFLSKVLKIYVHKIPAQTAQVSTLLVWLSLVAVNR